jgi:hypothetical protein
LSASGKVFAYGRVGWFSGDPELSQVHNPPENQACYRVDEQVTMVPFEMGGHYVKWREATHRSSQTRSLSDISGKTA